MVDSLIIQAPAPIMVEARLLTLDIHPDSADGRAVWMVTNGRGVPAEAHCPAIPVLLHPNPMRRDLIEYVTNMLRIYPFDHERGWSE